MKLENIVRKALPYFTAGVLGIGYLLNPSYGEAKGDKAKINFGFGVGQTYLYNETFSQFGGSKDVTLKLFIGAESEYFGGAFFIDNFTKTGDIFLKEDTGFFTGSFETKQVRLSDVLYGGEAWFNLASSIEDVVVPYIGAGLGTHRLTSSEDFILIDRGFFRRRSDISLRSTGLNINGYHIFGGIKFIPNKGGVIFYVRYAYKDGIDDNVTRRDSVKSSEIMGGMSFRF